MTTTRATVRPVRRSRPRSGTPWLTPSRSVLGLGGSAAVGARRRRAPIRLSTAPTSEDQQRGEQGGQQRGVEDAAADHAEQRVGDRPQQRSRRSEAGHQPAPRVGERAGGQQHRDPAGGQQPPDDDDLPAVPPELVAHLLDPLGVLAAGHPAHRRRPAEPADREGDQVAGQRGDGGDEHDQRQREVVGGRRERGGRADDRAGRHHRDDRAEQHQAEQQRVAERRTPSVQAAASRSVLMPAAAGEGRTTAAPGSVTTTGCQPAGGDLGGEGAAAGRPAAAASGRRSGERQRRHAGDGERAPVHGDGDPRADQRDRLGGARPGRGARGRGWGPSPRRAAARRRRPARPSTRHAVEQAGVAADVDGACRRPRAGSPSDSVAGPWVEPRAPAVAAVLGADGGDPQLAVGDRLAGATARRRAGSRGRAARRRRRAGTTIAHVGAERCAATAGAGGRRAGG